MATTRPGSRSGVTIAQPALQQQSHGAARQALLALQPAGVFRAYVLATLFQLLVDGSANDVGAIALSALDFRFKS